jgi:feruloyl esterase
MYQGWGDPLNGQTLPIQYRAAVIKAFTRQARESQTQATRQTDAFIRLFMVPGMAHCSGGIGPTRIEPLAALRAWVEDKRPPEHLIAVGEAGETRTVCQFPKIARRVGQADADRTEPSICQQPDSARKGQRPN